MGMGVQEEGISEELGPESLWVSWGPGAQCNRWVGF